VDMQSRWSKQSRVLVVGAGGLGAPIVLYLATSGVRRITIIDDDVVDVSNLQRQVIHTEHRVGQYKAESARLAALERNSTIEVVALNTRFTPDIALKLAHDHDVLVDATDNVATRYLINDAAVLAGKPVVSGSALRMEGQLTVYHYQGGPCYRCLFPNPPPAETVTNCSDGGVLGVVPGIIGVIQALETLKVLAGVPKSDVLAQRLLLLDASTTKFRTLNLRPRNPQCAVCGDEPTITTIDPKTHNVEFSCPMLQSDRAQDQVQDIVSTGSSKVLSVQKLKVQDFVERFYEKCPDTGCWQLKHDTPVVLLDVRENVQHKICSLPGSLNIPRSVLGYAASAISRTAESDSDSLKRLVNEGDLKPLFEALRDAAQKGAKDSNSTIPVVVYCRRGLDSVLACRHLEVIGSLSKFGHFDITPQPLNLVGGLNAFMISVDPSFPLY